ncbi:hypothetical protein [Streptosporangium sp. NPDC049644]|uniref:hypothetical protein n=1 Tax=Streptosporangium sp. NPDC049644 TaxID=3155507 RepID=UPI0034187066
MRVRVPGRAVMCLLAASLCELVVAAVSLVLLFVLKAELEGQRRIGDGTSFHTEFALGRAETLLWLCAAAGAITLALAALAWWRGGTVAIRTVMAVTVVPYTVFCYGLWWGSLLRAREVLGWHSYLAAWLLNLAWLLCLAGTILLFFTGPNARRT